MEEGDHPPKKGGKKEKPEFKGKKGKKSYFKKGKKGPKPEEGFLYFY